MVKQGVMPTSRPTCPTKNLTGLQKKAPPTAPPTAPPKPPFPRPFFAKVPQNIIREPDYPPPTSSSAVLWLFLEEKYPNASVELKTDMFIGLRNGTNPKKYLEKSDESFAEVDSPRCRMRRSIIAEILLAK